MKLKELREKRTPSRPFGWSQEELAEKCQLSRSTIQRIEQNPEYKPSRRILKKLCKGLKCKPEELE